MRLKINLVRYPSCPSPHCTSLKITKIKLGSIHSSLLVLIYLFTCLLSTHYDLHEKIEKRFKKSTFPLFVLFLFLVLLPLLPSYTSSTEYISLSRPSLQKTSSPPKNIIPQLISLYRVRVVINLPHLITYSYLLSPTITYHDSPLPGYLEID